MSDSELEIDGEVLLKALNDSVALPKSQFKYEIVGDLLLGFYENDTGTIFQSQVKLSDYDSELMASAAAQALGEQYSENYAEVTNETSTN